MRTDHARPISTFPFPISSFPIPLFSPTRTRLHENAKVREPGVKATTVHAHGVKSTCHC